jgi:hypothetical protein
MAKSPRYKRTIPQIELIDKYVGDGWENRLTHCRHVQLADQAINRIGSQIIHKWGRRYFDDKGVRAVVFKHTLQDGFVKLVVMYLQDDEGTEWIAPPLGY